MGKNKKKPSKGTSASLGSNTPKNGAVESATLEDTPDPSQASETSSVETSSDGVKDSESPQTAKTKHQNGEIPNTTPPDTVNHATETSDSHSKEIEALQARIKELETASIASNDDTELKKQLEEVTSDRDRTKASYDSLLSKLSSMKTVFSKMKEAQNELEETRDALQVEVERADTAEKERSELSERMKTLEQKNTDLNSECERLTSSLTLLRREYQSKDDSLQDERYELEVQNSRLSKTISELKAEITELKTARSEQGLELKDLQAASDDLREKLAEKEKQLRQQSDQVAALKAEVEQINSKGTHTARQHENKVLELEAQIEHKNSDIVKLTEQIEQQRKTIDEFGAEREKTKLLENDVNAKQLLIGKLRHEAIILNEHLTKALSMLKLHLSSDSNAIDKELVLNVLIGFLQFPRGDTKKYEALQLISALLDWDDDQKVAAGLSHNQTRRTEGRQSFVSLWTDFLEKESRGK